MFFRQNHCWCFNNCVWFQFHLKQMGRMTPSWSCLCHWKRFCRLLRSQKLTNPATMLISNLFKKVRKTTITLIAESKQGWLEIEMLDKSVKCKNVWSILASTRNTEVSHYFSVLHRFDGHLLSFPMQSSSTLNEHMTNDTWNIHYTQYVKVIINHRWHHLFCTDVEWPHGKHLRVPVWHLTWSSSATHYKSDVKRARSLQARAISRRR